MSTTLRQFVLPAIVMAVMWLQSSNEAYERGREALDRADWQGAVEAFEETADDPSVADAGLYWQAYAYNKLGESDRALELATSLAERFPSSQWRDDAEALRVEIRGQARGGTTSSPDPNADEELKLMALNALMHRGGDEAVPILEEFLAGNHSSRLKERALFILAQSRSDRAFELLAKAARDNATPELQEKAIRYLGVHHTERSLDLLVELYGSLDSVDARRRVLQSFMIAGEKDRLLELARSEPNPDLRGRAIRLLGTMDAGDELATMYDSETSEDVRKKILQAFMVSGDKSRLLAVARDTNETEDIRKSAIRLLGATGAHDELWDLYQSESSEEIKKRILHGLFISGEIDRVASVARDESTSDELRRAAIHNLGISGERSRPILLELYGGEASYEIKERVLHSLFLQNAASELIEIARTESDLDLKKKAVHWIALIDSPETKEFMMEILRR